MNIGNVGKVFSEDGTLVDEALVRRSDKFIREMIWMSKVLRHGREEVTIDDEATDARSAIGCPGCGAAMTHHADRLHASAAMMIAMHQYPACGTQQERATPAGISFNPE